MSTQRRRIAIWLSAGAAVTALTSVSWWLYQANLELDGKYPVSCGEAIRFFQTAQPPETARDRQCTRGHWQTTWYNMDFQASRTEAEAWLRAAYPDARVSHDCVNADLCSRATAPAGGPEDDSADYLRVDIRFGERDSAHVHVSGGTSN
ncbi:hypothetical protein [Streptomyces sp. NBC_01207]|uniref:hypothetical protein n=1 Tax=Streptomyces sp. NBC_01207 TaxID=2903772 RepID=UPI002E14FE36|nr:hypothetical protein OG457_01800 [Streptomyces sp. NBC_01207]